MKMKSDVQEAAESETSRRLSKESAADLWMRQGRDDAADQRRDRDDRAQDVGADPALPPARPIQRRIDRRPCCDLPVERKVPKDAEHQDGGVAARAQQRDERGEREEPMAERRRSGGSLPGRRRP